MGFSGDTGKDNSTQWYSRYCAIDNSSGGLTAADAAEILLSISIEGEKGGEGRLSASEYQTRRTRLPGLSEEGDKKKESYRSAE